MAANAAGFGEDAPDVGHLAARLDVEGRPREHDVALRPGTERLDLLAGGIEEREDGHARQPGRAVPLEGVARLLEYRARRVAGREEVGLMGASERALRPGPLALALHRPLEALAVDGDMALGCRVFDELHRQAVRVVQPEDVLASQGPGRGRLVEQVLEAGEPGSQHGLEPALFAGHHLGHVLVAGLQLRVRVAHLGHQHVDKRAQERLGEAQAVPVAHGPAHDLAQHVAAPLVRRHHAVRDQERHGAGMVGDDAGRHVRRLHRALIRAAREPADRREQGLEQVRVVIRQGALHDRGDAFEPHPRVDRRCRQRHERAVRLPIEFHEDVVPDLDEAVAGALHAAAHRFRAGQVLAAVVVDFRAAAAGARLAHRPEVVGRSQFGDARARQHPQPVLVRLVVAGHAAFAAEHRREEPVGRQVPHVGQQGPGEGDRVSLEVIAEREIAEHLEEGVMPERRPDVLEVVVLAADPHALLRTGRAPVVAPVPSEEDVLELVHPRVGEQERGVVSRHQRRTRDDTMAVLFEEPEKCTAKLARGHPAIVASGGGIRG